MTRPEIEATHSKPSSLFIAIGFTIFLLLYIRQEGRNLFDWSTFNPNVINGMAFLFFLVICLVWWLRVFDKRAVLKLNQDGIWIRSSVLVFSKRVFIAWNDVTYFYVFKETRKVTTQSIMIGRKEGDKEKKIDISGLDKPIDEILDVLKKYSAAYDFQDLGKEIKP
jgi:hypothetical protein